MLKSWTNIGWHKGTPQWITCHVILCENCFSTFYYSSATLSAFLQIFRPFPPAWPWREKSFENRALEKVFMGALMHLCRMWEEGTKTERDRYHSKRRKKLLLAIITRRWAAAKKTKEGKRTKKKFLGRQDALSNYHIVVQCIAVYGNWYCFVLRYIVWSRVELHWYCRHDPEWLAWHCSRSNWKSEEKSSRSWRMH